MIELPRIDATPAVASGWTACGPSDLPGGTPCACDPRIVLLLGTTITKETIYIMAMRSSNDPQQTFFRVTDNVPEQAWYWAAVVSILISATLKLTKKDDWALFVGQWPPTFLLFGLYHRLFDLQD